MLSLNKLKFVKQSLPKAFGILSVVFMFVSTPFAVEANPRGAISVKTDSQGRVVGLSNLADPEVLRGTTCGRQINSKGVISQVSFYGTPPSIVGIQFEGRYYNISRTLRSTPQINNFLTSGNTVSITYTAIGVSCRRLFVESIVPVTRERTPASDSSRNITPSSNHCPAALAVKQELEQRYGTRVRSFERRDISEQYPDHPPGRSEYYVFALAYMATGTARSSTPNLVSLTKRIVEECSSVGAVEWGQYKTDNLNYVGLFPDGRIRFFECAAPGIIAVRWGRIKCGLLD